MFVTGFGKKSSELINQRLGRSVKTAKTVMWALALILVGSVVGGFVPSLVHAKGPAQTERIGQISQSELPPQGRETYGKILQGGPFPHEKDGVVFGNRERLLPVRNRGYYHEYTVSTPGASHRATRRIVCGGAPRTPDTCYYTADHYASFRRIVP